MRVALLACCNLRCCAATNLVGIGGRLSRRAWAALAEDRRGGSQQHRGTLGRPFGGLLFDATGIAEPAWPARSHEFFTPLLRNNQPVQGSSSSAQLRIRPAPTSASPSAPWRVSPARWAGDATRRHGRWSPIPEAKPAATGLESTSRFLLSAKSAYVDGRVFTSAPADPTRRQTGTGRWTARSPSSPVPPADQRHHRRVFARDGAAVVAWTSRRRRDAGRTAAKVDGTALTWT